VRGEEGSKKRIKARVQQKRLSSLKKEVLLSVAVQVW